MSENNNDFLKCSSSCKNYDLLCLSEGGFLRETSEKSFLGNISFIGEIKIRP